MGMRLCTSHTGFWRLTSFKFDSRLSWIWIFFFVCVKTSHSRFPFQSCKTSPVQGPNTVHEQLVAGWSAPQKFRRLIVRSYSLIGLRLDDCSKAVQLLLDTIIAARIKRLIGWQICPILFLCKIKYLWIYLQVENVVPITFFLHMLSLQLYRFSSESCSTFVTYEQHPDKASYISTKPEIDSWF